MSNKEGSQMLTQKPHPDAFEKQFPPILHVPTLEPRIKDRDDCHCYKMGVIEITYYEPTQIHPSYNLGMSHPERYPTWDEMVWIRYQLLPDGITMALILPPLEDYINFEDKTGHSKHTFTMQSVEPKDNRYIEE
jgi:hypothetical protein